MQLKDIRIGKVDGKHEFISGSANEQAFFDAYLIPNTLNLNAFATKELYFVQGFRGTGKTSFLRYFLFRHAASDHVRRLILCKSDLTEQQRIQISTHVGIEWADTDSDRMALAQDFKDAWAWFVLHKIGEMIIDDPDIVESGPVEGFLDALGLRNKDTLRRYWDFCLRSKVHRSRSKRTLAFLRQSWERTRRRVGIR